MKVTITSLKRLTNSASGNPTWLLKTTGGMFRTKTDASVGYELGWTYEGKDVELELDSRGRVVGVAL